MDNWFARGLYSLGIFAAVFLGALFWASAHVSSIPKPPLRDRGGREERAYQLLRVLANLARKSCTIPKAKAARAVDRMTLCCVLEPVTGNDAGSVAGVVVEAARIRGVSGATCGVVTGASGVAGVVGVVGVSGIVGVAGVLQSLSWV